MLYSVISPAKKLATPEGKTLYDFWSDQVTHAVNRRRQDAKTDYLLNLASNEYFQSLIQALLKTG